jgi:hypothetical protein
LYNIYGTKAMSPASLIVWRYFLIVVCVFSSLSPARFRLWAEQEGHLTWRGVSSLSGRLITHTPSTDTVIDNTIYILSLNDGVASVRQKGEQGKTLWESPPDWRVTEAFFSDLNRDGVDEISLLVWRAYRPWPVDRLLHFPGMTKDFKDETGQSCQLILLNLTGNEVREAWAGSAMAAPLHDLQVLDLDGDGYQELAALEQPYDDKSAASSVVIWRWNGFGFSLDDRLEGNYTDLSILQDQVQSWLVIR